MVSVCKPLRDNMLSIFSIRKLVVSPFTDSWIRDIIQLFWSYCNILRFFFNVFCTQQVPCQTSEWQTQHNLISFISIVINMTKIWDSQIQIHQLCLFVFNYRIGFRIFPFCAIKKKHVCLLLWLIVGHLYLSPELITSL